MSDSAALSIARRAVNGWACYAKREIEHREIAALHAEIDKVARAQPVADSAEILSSERSTSDRPRDRVQELLRSAKSSDGRAAALDAAPSSGIAADCWYCMAPGFLYRHSGGYNISMCDKCRDAGQAAALDAIRPRRESRSRERRKDRRVVALITDSDSSRSEQHAKSATGDKSP